MKVLIVKTSSLGDVVHALPAVTEASAKLNDVDFSWVVEEDLQDIPAHHPGVKEVIPVAIRRWRKSVLKSVGEVRQFTKELGSRQFDVVMDSQGLIKSALISRLAKGPRHGFDKASAREPLAATSYDQKHTVDTSLHAIDRQMSLFAKSLGYESDHKIDYGFQTRYQSGGAVVLLHGTTWKSKEWPEESWRELAQMIAGSGHELIVPAGDEREFERAGRITEGLGARVLRRPPLKDLIAVLSNAAGVVSVDTGLGHLGAAFDLPLVGIFGATDPNLTGMKSAHTDLIVSNYLPCIPCRKRDCQFRRDEDSSSIYPPCYEHTTPEAVWQALLSQIGNRPVSPG